MTSPTRYSPEVRERAVREAVLRRAGLHLRAAYDLGVGTFAALDLSRAPLAEAEALERTMRRQYGVRPAATINFAAEFVTGVA